MKPPTPETTQGRHRRENIDPGPGHSEWHTIGFLPAPDGWRLVFINPDGGIALRRLPGWLIEEEVDYTAVGIPRENQPQYPARRVVAGMEVRGAIYAAPEEHDGFYRVIGPYEAKPEYSEIVGELRRRAVMTEAMAMSNTAGESLP